MADSSLSTRLTSGRTIRPIGAALSVLVLIAAGTATAVSGASGPTVSLELVVDLPYAREFSGGVSAEWERGAASVRLLWGAGEPIPDVTLEGRGRWGSVRLSGSLGDVLHSPLIAGTMGLEMDPAVVTFGSSFSFGSRTLAGCSRSVDVVVSPFKDVEIGARALCTSAGALVPSLNLDARVLQASVACRAGWDDAGDFSASYSIEVPSLLVGVTGIIHQTALGQNVETAWYPVLTRVSELAEGCAVLARAAQPVTQSAGAPSSRGVGPGCAVCEATRTQASSASCTFDFGDVRIGETGHWTEPLECDRGDFCFLYSIPKYPSAPFSVVSAPLRQRIPPWGVRTLELAFTPQRADRYDDTMTLYYCYAVWVIDDEPIGDDVGAYEPGHYEARCSYVTCRLTGVGVAPPEARAKIIPENPVCGSTVQFDASQSTDPNPGGVITAYEWQFGDGAAASGVRVTHSYGRSGSYVIQLTVRNNRGMVSEPLRMTLDVAPDLVEAAAIAGVAVAAGAATAAFAAAPPLLAAAVPGSLLAVAALIHELEGARFPVNQLIVRFPSSWDVEDVRQLMERNVPGSQVLGHFSTLNTFLIQVPVSGESAAAAAAELAVIQERLSRVLPYGTDVGRNHIGLFEQGREELGLRSGYDLERLDADLRAAYEAVRAPEAWRRICSANLELAPVRIAVVDSGIRADHQEFLIPLRGRSYVATSDGATEPWYEDESGHGTRVSGIIGAENGAGRMNGMLSGTAGPYEMQVYRVLGDVFSVWDCVRIAVSDADEQLGAWREAVRAGVRRESVVVNISVGWDLEALPENERALETDAFRDLLNLYLRTLFVTSAGNGDTPDDLARSVGRRLAVGDDTHAPGGVSAPNNLTVGATNRAGTELASWSNYGPAVDIAAPGEDVYTTDDDGGYVWRVEGSSYAAALVSGAAGALLAVDCSLTAQRVKEILMASPRRVSTPDGSTIPVLDFDDAMQRAIQARVERDRRSLWRSSAVTLGALALGFLVLRPF